MLSMLARYRSSCSSLMGMETVCDGRRYPKLDADRACATVRRRWMTRRFRCSSSTWPSPTSIATWSTVEPSPSDPTTLTSPAPTRSSPAATVGGTHRSSRRARGSAWCSRTGVGYDNVNLDDAAAAGVVVCYTPQAPTVSTAEHTIALMLAITKQLPMLQARAAAGLPGATTASSLELDGARLGLVGLGRIASRGGDRRSGSRDDGGRLRPVHRRVPGARR